MRIRSKVIATLGALACAIPALRPIAQEVRLEPEEEAGSGERSSPVLGIYNWVHTTGNADLAFEFFRDVFGLELAPSPFYGDPNAPPSSIRTAAEAGSDPLVWNLTNTHGARFRTAFMRAPNTPFGLELAEFFDIPRSARMAQPWDPGASILRFDVRDLSEIVGRARGLGATIVTTGGEAIDTPRGRSIVMRNADGYLIEATQAAPQRIADAAAGDVVATSIGITVTDMSSAAEFYEGLLGFVFEPARAASNDELRLYGLSAGRLSRTETTIPGTDTRVVFSQFSLPPEGNAIATPIRWAIQDVGAPQFQLQVAGLDRLLERTRQAGFDFLSIGAEPIMRPFGRFVFVIDADGVLVEFVEPADSR